MSDRKDQVRLRASGLETTQQMAETQHWQNQRQPRGDPGRGEGSALAGFKQHRPQGHQLCISATDTSSKPRKRSSQPSLVGLKQPLCSWSREQQGSLRPRHPAAPRSLGCSIHPRTSRYASGEDTEERKAWREELGHSHKLL